MSISEITRPQQKAYVGNINNYTNEETTTPPRSRKEYDRFIQRAKETSIIDTASKNSNFTKGIPTDQFETIKRISEQYEALMLRDDARALDDFIENDGMITEDGRAVFVTPFEIPYRGVLYSKSKVVEYDELGRPTTVAINNSTEQRIIKYDYWSATVRRTEEK